MSALKTIVIVLLSLLLTLCLTVFGLLFSMNRTALNANYVKDRLETLPVAALLEEAEFDEGMEDNPELAELIESVILDNEAEFKQKTGELVDIVYDYLKGKSDNLYLAQALSQTVMDADFAISIVANADLAPLTEEIIDDMLDEVILPYDLSIEPNIDDIAHDLEPWLKTQAATTIPPVFDYILGFSQDTNITISLEQPTEIIRDTLRQEFLQSPPAEFAGMTPVELEQEFERVFNDFAGDIPTEVDISAEFIASDMQTDFAQSLADVEEAFAESQRYVGYFNLVYGMLIGFILLLIAGIILIYREVKGASRTLGSIFLSYGIFSLIAVLVARGVSGGQISRLEDIPPSMQTWITQSISSTLTPMLILAIMLLIIGAALLALSFLYKRNQPAGSYTPS